MTLFTSVTDLNIRGLLRTGFAYVFIAIFCAFFGAIYEAFSHGICSLYMIYAFAFPLVGGAAVTLLYASFPHKVYRRPWSSGCITPALPR
ncbi:hypothetical protein FACS1894184_05880 [Clostridia bacterium]|nr:hypothetical protein FACS1894184_05880 [Clostridia bacterium]